MSDTDSDRHHSDQPCASSAGHGCSLCFKSEQASPARVDNFLQLGFVTSAYKTLQSQVCVNAQTLQSHLVQQHTCAQDPRTPSSLWTLIWRSGAIWRANPQSHGESYLRPDLGRNTAPFAGRLNWHCASSKHRLEVFAAHVSCTAVTEQSQ